MTDLYAIAVNGTQLAVNIPTGKIGRMVDAYVEANEPELVTITVIPLGTQR